MQVSMMIDSWAVVLGDDATVETQHEFDALCISKQFVTVGSVQRSQWQSVLLMWAHRGED
jgi:hypothetical protein